MNLNSGKVVNARKVTELPVTDLVIRTVEKMAEKDDIKCLKFENKQGIPIYPNDLIAGVDYNHPQHYNNQIANQEEQDVDDNIEDKYKLDKEGDEIPNLITDNEDDESDESNDEQFEEDEKQQQQATEEEIAEITGVPKQEQPEVEQQDSPVNQPESEQCQQPQPTLRRSTRVREMVQQYEPTMKGNTHIQIDEEPLYNIVSEEPHELAEYDTEVCATMIAQTIDEFNQQVILKDEKSFIQTIVLKKE